MRVNTSNAGKVELQKISKLKAIVNLLNDGFLGGNKIAFDFGKEQSINSYSSLKELFKSFCDNLINAVNNQEELKIFTVGYKDDKNVLTKIELENKEEIVRVVCNVYYSLTEEINKNPGFVLSDEEKASYKKFYDRFEKDEVSENKDLKPVFDRMRTDFYELTDVKIDEKMLKEMINNYVISGKDITKLIKGDNITEFGVSELVNFALENKKLANKLFGSLKENQKINKIKLTNNASIAAKIFAERFTLANSSYKDYSKLTKAILDGFNLEEAIIIAKEIKKNLKEAKKFKKDADDIDLRSFRNNVEELTKIFAKAIGMEVNSAGAEFIGITLNQAREIANEMITDKEDEKGVFSLVFKPTIDEQEKESNASIIEAVLKDDKAYSEEEIKRKTNEAKAGNFRKCDFTPDSVYESLAVGHAQCLVLFLQGVKRGREYSSSYKEIVKQNFAYLMNNFESSQVFANAFIAAVGNENILAEAARIFAGSSEDLFVVKNLKKEKIKSQIASEKMAEANKEKRKEIIAKGIN